MAKPQLNIPIRSFQRSPSAINLLEQLRTTAWTCASINAAICATYPPKLYVTTTKSQTAPRCMTNDVPVKARRLLLDRLQVKSTNVIQEVTKHPLLTLLDTVNPYMNAFDLWELTTLYQETVGSTFWFLEKNAFGRPIQIWPLPSHWVSIYPYLDGGFEFFYNGQSFHEDQIIHFRYPDPSNPYYYGLSPLRAAFTEVRISSSYADLKLARFDNRAMPDVILTPKEPIGQEERARLEGQWANKFRRGGNGRALVSESDLGVQLLNAQMGDLALLAEKGKNSEDICNAFHVPLSMLSTNTNLANLQASEAQHARVAINPRLTRRDEKLTEQLVPMFDPSGRLYLRSDDPGPDVGDDWRIIDSGAKYGYLTINELRDFQGLPAVPWGNVPCPQNSASQSNTEILPR